MKILQLISQIFDKQIDGLIQNYKVITDLFKS